MKYIPKMLNVKRHDINPQLDEYSLTKEARDKAMEDIMSGKFHIVPYSFMTYMYDSETRIYGSEKLMPMFGVLMLALEKDDDNIKKKLIELLK